MKLFILITTILICTPLASLADDTEGPTELRKMPTGKIIELEGVSYKAFTLDEWKQVGLLAADYVWLFNRHSLVDQQYKLQLEMSDLYELRQQNCTARLKILETDRDFWKVRVKEEQKFRLKSHTASVIYQVVMGVELAAIIAMGLAMGFGGD